ncbi:MAG: FtsX-like permease family protein [Gemmatimonadota bacterium]|nr:MAG: FtsX-like permease family protein [Gemmatimonadota bacterium]
MSTRFVLAMARRESRAMRRRLALYIVAITLGIAALVAINSFKANVTGAVRAQSRTLLGADLVLGSRWEFTPQVESVFDSLTRSGAAVARSTSFASMALATRTGRTRLVEVLASSGGYPFYGAVTTEPAGLWLEFPAGRQALVDPGLLVQLDAGLGDTLAVGQARFSIAGTVTRAPRDFALRAVIGPRVYIPSSQLEATGLLSFGSISYHEAYLKLRSEGDAELLEAAYDSLFEANRVWSTTVSEYEENLATGLERLGSFLALVGLVALLLGGVGVASGVHVFVREKLDTVAVLRCLGARQRQAFLIYLVQAGLMGLGGAALGVALGIAVQLLLPIVLGDFLPLDVPFRLEPFAIAGGLAIGLGVSLLFALLPLLQIKDVPPLRALRRDYEVARRRRDIWRYGAWASLVLGLLFLTLWQAPEPAIGLAFAGAIAITTAALALTAFLLRRGTRRFFPRRSSFALRQGIANLFRPHNQTMAVTLAIGFGVFLVATLYVVQRNLLDQLAMETRPDRPNLFMFDIQLDQEEGIERLLADRDVRVLQRAPLVSSRLTRIGERSVEEILADTTGRRVPRWALMREYRHTYRDTLTASERLVAGEWFAGGPAEDAGQTPQISLEEDIAELLHVSLGDRLTWDIQGVPVETEIGSLRRVDWARFEPNFFAVFEPGVLEGAPQSLILLTHVDEPRRRAELQRDLVASYPNVSAIDLTIILEAVDAILGKVALAIRFMALFSIGSGLVILVGAIATSRYQRARESVLLKTLGARSRLIRRMLAVEYFTLGMVAGLAGVVLAAVAGWVAVVFQFELKFFLPGLPLIGFWLATAVVTTLIGLVNSRDIVRRTPLAGMRDFSE